MLATIYIMAFLAAFCLAMAILKTLDKKGEVQERLEMVARAGHGAERKERQRLSLADLFRKVSTIFAASSFTEKMQIQLLQAGIPLKGEEFITLWLGIALASPLVAYLLTFNIPLTFLLFLLGVGGPRFYLLHKKNEKLKKLNEQLGDALVIMANALRAGFGFQQAMDTVRKELPPPIANEFEWTLREINLGSTTEEALLHMTERVKSDDLDMIVTAMLIQRQVGGNLAQILDNISRTIRERTRIKGQIKTLTAQGRLSGIIIGLLPVGLIFLLLIINPGYMNTMLESPLGFYLLGAGAISELIGLLIINKIVNIDF